MGQMKTPGVYVVEKNAFPNSVVEVATAVPAFVGYTQTASNKGKSLRNVPWRISSMSEFCEYFGYGPTPLFDIVERPPEADTGGSFSVGGVDYGLSQIAGNYLLYTSMQLFFQNGGGPCYIVSVGGYEDEIAADKLSRGIELLLKEREPTLLVIPETVRLSESDAIGVQQAALAHCGGAMKNRLAILDVWGGSRDRQDPSGDCVENFRSGLGINYLDYAAAYYPWLRSTVVKEQDLSFVNIGNVDRLKSLIKAELGLPDAPPVLEDQDPPALRTAKGRLVAQLDTVEGITASWEGMSEGDAASRRQLLDKTLRAFSGIYREILAEAQYQLNLLPPSAALAGVYTMVDNSRGVWKAPANVSLNAVVAPSVNITHDEQEDLNVTTQGKSINAIRAFIGEGVLVWGARTLDGNSLDWRYINVRRTMIMLEESIRLACKAYVFEPNVSNTWVTVRGMIRNFLTGVWKRGGLAGASPEDAFSVHVGLGETMTPEDILEGILKVTVLVAISRPAEFIEITFQQQMQKS